ncbi:MAG: PD-(D/E)XK nuclease family protein [Flavobacteriaceae bacterium]
MQQSFLEYVLKDLQKKGTPLHSSTFILPSKRSGTFLKKYISETLTQNTFCPEILSIEDFIEDISGISSTSSIELLITLYKTYKDSEIENQDDFFSFLKWGQTLLQDFNEIDRYLIPSHEILNYLSAIKELTHWSLKKEKTELVENYLQLWGNLKRLYDAFTSVLLTKNIGYQGLIYKTAVENLSKYKSEANKNLIFIGFNALNNAESLIIQHFLTDKNNRIYWDIDTHFLNDPIHDAGLFIRNYKKEWPYYTAHEMDGVHSSFTSPKKISITGVPKNISQAKYAGKLLQEIADDTTPLLKNTALILADESLLNPMLQAIPENITQVNVTMGIPLNKTVLYSFFLSFLELYTSKTNKGWFHKKVLAFTSNPYSAKISISEQLDFVDTISSDIKENNWVNITSKNLSSYPESHPLLKIIFPKNKISSQEWIKNCLLLIEILKDSFQQEKNSLELEYLYRFYTIFNQLKLYLNELDFTTDLKSIKNFFKQLSALESMDFIGDPLSGLQIMGMLESRNLDFETVILTAVNEGILPSGKSNNSFIPFDVKREFGLPTYKEKDAIYTYHFYRLLQRAKNIHIIYNTEPDVLEGGEKSRLINQLLTDPKINEYITHTIAAPQVKISRAQTFQIQKTDQLIADIKKFAAKGFSPTSLTNYIRNPIEFYKGNILKIRELGTIEETIAANTFGTIIHDSLEQLYTPVVGKVLTLENLSILREKIPKTVTEHFHKNLQETDITTGRFLLVFSVIVKYLQNFIALELNQIKKHQVKILELEKKYTMPLGIQGLDFPITLTGTIDRVDAIDGITRIVDYKTGKVEPRNVKLKDWEPLLLDYDKSKAFQLLCYSLLYSNEKKVNHISSGIYSFKNLGQGFLPLSVNGEGATHDTLKTFETHLARLILEICSPAIPFEEKVL